MLSPRLVPVTSMLSTRSVPVTSEISTSRVRQHARESVPDHVVEVHLVLLVRVPPVRVVPAPIAEFEINCLSMYGSAKQTNTRRLTVLNLRTTA